jgi:hypothetical protein
VFRSDLTLGCHRLFTTDLMLAPARGGVGSRSGRHIVAERGGSPEFEFSQATVVSFQ